MPKVTRSAKRPLARAVSQVQAKRQASVTADYDILPFENAAAFREWLGVHHRAADGVWLKIFKKASNTPTISYQDGLREALCFGWIDGQRKSHDASSFIQKFTPRRPRSTWSKRNIGIADELMASGLMMAPGLVEVERAKADGRWDAAYAGQSTMQMPQDFLDALKDHPAAEEFYSTLKKSSQYVIAMQLHTAKTAETRQRRQTKFIDKLIAKKHP